MKVAAIHKLRWKNNPRRPTCLIPGVETNFRYSQGKLLRRQGTEWKVVCNECFNVAKGEKCDFHLRTVTEITVYKVNSPEISSELSKKGNKAKVYWVGKSNHRKYYFLLDHDDDDDDYEPAHAMTDLYYESLEYFFGTKC